LSLEPRSAITEPRRTEMSFTLSHEFISFMRIHNYLSEV
jgi:hypothetical protein